LPPQCAIDRRSRYADPVTVLEVPANGVRTGVETLGDELPSELDDQVDRRLRDRRR
jgi:hypothetical protein